MSAESATALYERINSDEAFKAQLEGAPTPDDKRRIVTEAGYDVNRDDLPTVHQLAGMTELSDEDMEKMAGGNLPADTALPTRIIAAAFGVQ